MKKWPEGGPALAWKIQGIGAGYSSVSVSKGRIFTMGDLADGQYAFALKEDGGELLWKTPIVVGQRSDLIQPPTTISTSVKLHT